MKLYWEESGFSSGLGGVFSKWILIILVELLIFIIRIFAIFFQMTNNKLSYKSSNKIIRFYDSRNLPT